MTTFDLIASEYRMGCQLVHSLCADLTPVEFQHQPVPCANSAAWIVGHLALVTQRTAERLGATGVPPVGDEFVARYKATRQPAATLSELGNKEELLALLDASIERLMETIKGLPPEALTGPSPRGAPPFVRNSAEMMLFGTMHISMHCGQLSTIRRSLGKLPLV